MSERLQRAALMFALVMILGLCLGLALWRAFRDHPTNKDGLFEESRESALRDYSTNHIEEPGENDTIAEMDSYKNSRAKRSECEEGVNWIDIDETAYDIDPRSSISDNACSAPTKSNLHKNGSDSFRQLA